MCLTFVPNILLYSEGSVKTGRGLCATCHHAWAGPFITLSNRRVVSTLPVLRQGATHYCSQKYPHPHFEHANSELRLWRVV